MIQWYVQLRVKGHCYGDRKFTLVSNVVYGSMSLLNPPPPPPTISNPLHVPLTHLTWFLCLETWWDLTVNKMEGVLSTSTRGTRTAD